MHFKAILVTVTLALGNVAIAEPIDIEARHTIGSWHPPENTLEARNIPDVLEARHTIGSWHPQNTLEVRHTIGSWHPPENILEARSPNTLEVRHTIGSWHPPEETHTL